MAVLLSLWSCFKVPTDMSYQTPRKVILSKEQLQAFQESKTHGDIVSYIETLNESVVGVKLTDECEVSHVGRSHSHLKVQIRMDIQGTSAVLEILNQVEKVARETPPVDNAASRFGNPAFRTFYDKIEEVRRLKAQITITLRLIFRPQQTYIPFYQTFLQKLYLRFLHTSKRPGEIEHESIMEVVWS